MSKEVRISLDAKMFRALVRGGEVKIKSKKTGFIIPGSTPEVRIILQDIGFNTMRGLIDGAQTSAESIEGLRFHTESIEVED